MQTTWAGLDDAAWHEPGGAPSDAGGPPWSLAEHVGHIADWQELAIDYTRGRSRLASGRPTANTTTATSTRSTSVGANHGRRCRVTRSSRGWKPPDRRLIEVAQRLSPETIRSDDGWDWVYPALHGHYLDHLAVIEPWTAELRRPGAAH